MGLKYAARAGGRGRARWAGRAEPAHEGWFAGFGAGACRGVIGGSAPLPSGAACPADSPHYTWGRMTCGCFFPLETYRPALRAGVGEFGGRGSAAFGATADSGAQPPGELPAKPAEGRRRFVPLTKGVQTFGTPPAAFRRPPPLKRGGKGLAATQRREQSHKRQHLPTPLTKAFFWGGTWGPQGPAPAYFTPRR